MQRIKSLASRLDYRNMGGDTLEECESVVKFMNNKHGLDVILVVSEAIPHGMYIPAILLVDFPEMISEVTGRKSEDLALETTTGVVVVRPDMLSSEIVSHEMGHAVYQTKVPFNVAGINAMKAKLAYKAVGTAIVFSTHVMRKNLLLGFAIGFAIEVPTLVEEAMATKYGLAALKEMEVETDVGLYGAYGTYLFKALGSAVGGGYVDVVSIVATLKNKK